MDDLERGQRIKALRAQQHLSQPAVIDLLEEEAGARVVTLRGYQAWEAGGGIRWDNAKILARVFNVDPEYIMGGTRPTPGLFAIQGDGDKLDRILDQLEIARYDRIALREEITQQNELLAAQRGLLDALRAEVDALQAMHAALPEFLRAQVEAARQPPRTPRGTPATNPPTGGQGRAQ